MDHSTRPVLSLIVIAVSVAVPSSAPITAAGETSSQDRAGQIPAPQDQAPHDQAPHDQAPHDQAPHDQAPEAAPNPPRAVDDEERLAALRFQIEDWRSGALETRHHSLTLETTVLPDAVAFHVVSEYLAHRKTGKDHDAAVALVAEKLPRWKRFEKRALVRLVLTNDRHELSRKNHRRVFTLEKNLEKTGIALRSGKKRLPTKLAGKPSALRLTKLRKKKFWTTRDGATGRGGAKDKDAGSVGRVPLLSKPFAALVLEKDPATIDLIVRPRDLERSRGRKLHLSLERWKRYEGPFKDDVLDLNDHRPWDELEELTAPIRLPAGRFGLRDSTHTLVDEVRLASRSS